jgi:transcriptional regulator with XRE-family HTH domain
MPDIYQHIGNQIRELRTTLRGKGISQADLAEAVKTTANTVSRWETATYKPSIADLQKLARVFGVPITSFFPQPESRSQTNTLLTATVDLDEEDLEELTLYALFRGARRQTKQKR